MTDTMKNKFYFKNKHFITGLLFLIALQVNGQNYDYDEIKGYFLMSYQDTIKIAEIAKDNTEELVFEDFDIIKWKTGELNLRILSVFACQGDDVHIIIKYTDGTISDSKKSDNISYQHGNSLDITQWNISKPISKIRLTDEYGYLYEITGFTKTNILIKEFKNLSYKQLNSKYNKSVDIYDGL